MVIHLKLKCDLISQKRACGMWHYEKYSKCNFLLLIRRVEQKFHCSEIIQAMKARLAGSGRVKAK